mgnify:CR=1 FL=1
MKTYIKFIINTYIKSFFYVFLIVFSLVFILNILSEIEFFKNFEVAAYFPIYTSFLNSPSLFFEIFPFVFLIGTQVFFINLFQDRQIEIFKYSGLKNSKILHIISIISFLIGILIIILFYNLSSNLKNAYLEIKSNYTPDNKYLAVVTKNGLWIKDNYKGKISIIHASKISKNLLIDTFITEFNENYDVLRNIHSNKINIKNENWVAHDATIYENNTTYKKDLLSLYTNFNYRKIQSLFSNLSSLSILELYDLRKNYKLLELSTTEVDIQLQKIFTLPIYLTLMTILSTIIMFNTKNYNSNTLKITIGLFLSVIIYYINNFFNVMGKTERISLEISIWFPLIILILINSIMIYRINEK